MLVLLSSQKAWQLLEMWGRMIPARWLSRTLLVSMSATLVSLVGIAPAHAAPGDELWDDVLGTYYSASTYELAVASDGRVFATGFDTVDDGDVDYATVAFSRGGKRLWVKHYHGPRQDPAHDGDTASDIALGPTEHRLYVTGTSWDRVNEADWATVAYRADGTRLWARRYDGPAGLNDAHPSIAVSEQTGRIFVTGNSSGKNSGSNITTIAYSPRGHRLWTRRYDGPANGSDEAADVLVARGGRRLYVAGTTATANAAQDVVVIAYRANGARIWRHRFDGPTSGDDSASSATLGPNGRHLYVTGGSDHDYLTMAYRRDGAQLWSDRYDGPAGEEDFGTEVVVAPDSRSIFVTGQSRGAIDDDVATLSYTADGARRWVTRYDSSDTDSPGSIAMSPDGGHVFVATGDSTFTTIAYTSDGNQDWIKRDGWNGEGAEPNDIAVSPDGTFVVVTGVARDIYWFAGTIAYSTH